MPNRTDAAAASEKPRGDVRNWAHCADEDESDLGAEPPANSIVTADRLGCGARVCRRDAELLCNTSAVRQHYSKSGVGSRAGVAGARRCRQQHPKKLTIFLRRSELTLRATNGLMHRSSAMLFNHLVDAGKQRWRNVKADCFCTFEVEH